LALRDGKDVQVHCPLPMTVEFNRLVGVNKITSELGNRNLIIRFLEYQANDIERVSYDIEDGQFKLSVIPKPGITPPAKDRVSLSYSGISAETVILVGGTNDSHFPAISTKELSGVEIIHLGTKEINLSGKSVLSFARPASSVSEIVGILLKESGYRIDADIATNLLMGIEEVSDSFSSQDATADTFLLISELMRAGGKRQQISPTDAGNYPPGAILQAANPPGQSLQSQTAQENVQNVQVEEDDQPATDNPPKDWFEPKIFKGTSIK
jgi:hypothetical protein